MSRSSAVARPLRRRSAPLLLVPAVSVALVTGTPTAAEATTSLGVVNSDTALLGYGARSAMPSTGVVTDRASDAQAARESRRASRKRARLVPGTRAFGRAVLRHAARQAGKPYRWGGAGPRGFDCSGFTRYVYRQVGVRLPRTARAQRAATRRIPRSRVVPGDLVFVHTGGRVSHAAIVAGGGRWWESARPGTTVRKKRAWTSRVSYGRARR
jgi:cell wall-associated NlpC family hydrolase